MGHFWKIDGGRILPAELGYKIAFRKLMNCWSEAYEPGTGSGVGYPDLQLLVGGVLVPVELKTGKLENGRLYPSRIRGAQVIWHHDFMAAGGRSFIVVCCGPAGAMDAWALPRVHRDVTSSWKNGYPLAECRPWVLSGKRVFAPSGRF